MVIRLDRVENEAATGQLAVILGGMLAPGDVVTLNGGLGVGKTVFARALIRALMADVTLEVPSPTFTLVQIYNTRMAPLWHFDLYRLSGFEEVVELGWDEALVDGIVLVEWPDRLGPLLPPNRLDVTLDHDPAGDVHARQVMFRGYGAWNSRISGISARLHQ